MPSITRRRTKCEPLRDPYYSFLLSYFNTREIVSVLSLLSKWHYNILKSASNDHRVVQLITREFTPFPFNLTQEDLEEQAMQSAGSSNIFDGCHVWKVREEICDYIKSRSKQSQLCKQSKTPKMDPYVLIHDMYEFLLMFKQNFTSLTKLDEMNHDFILTARQKLKTNTEGIFVQYANETDQLFVYTNKYPDLRVLFFAGAQQPLEFLLFSLLRDPACFIELSGGRCYREDCGHDAMWYDKALGRRFEGVICNVFGKLFEMAMNSHTLVFEERLSYYFESSEDIIHRTTRDTWKVKSWAEMHNCNKSLGDKKNDDEFGERLLMDIKNGESDEKTDEFVDNLIYDLRLFDSADMDPIWLVVAVEWSDYECNGYHAKYNSFVFLKDLMVSCIKYGMEMIENGDKKRVNTMKFRYDFDYWYWIVSLFHQFRYGKEFAAIETRKQVLTGELENYLEYATYEGYQMIYDVSMFDQFWIPLIEQAFDCTFQWIDAILKSLESKRDKTSKNEYFKLFEPFLRKIILFLGVMADGRQNGMELLQPWQKVVKSHEETIAMLQHDEDIRETEKELQYLTKIYEKLVLTVKKSFEGVSRVCKASLERIFGLLSNDFSKTFKEAKSPCDDDVEVFFCKLFIKYEKGLYSDWYVERYQYEETKAEGKAELKEIYNYLLTCLPDAVRVKLDSDETRKQMQYQS